MANELTPVELFGPNRDGEKIRFTIADGVSVSQGALLQLLDERTVSYSHLGHSIIAGIASEEHTANNGITSIGVYTQGIFRAVCSGAVLAGQLVTTAELNDKNLIMASSGAITAASMALVFGRCLDTADSGSTVSVKLINL